MPSEADHLAKAERNERFSDTIASAAASAEQFQEWEIVALFYSALHYVDAYLDHSVGTHPASHRERRYAIANSPELWRIRRLYSTLYNYSLDARYSISSFSGPFVQDIRVNYYNRLKIQLRSLIEL